MRRTVVAAVVSCTIVAGCDAPVRPPSPPSPSVGQAAFATAPTQSAADEISTNIQNRHLIAEFPAPTIVDPRFASDNPESPDYETVVGYVRAGDAAIWTGHYLAAEALRFAETGSGQALANARRALNGIQGLVDVTAASMPRNPGLLARFLWPVTWQYADQMAAEEQTHGGYSGTAAGAPHRWIGNTSRDQYSGVFFGLAIAYDAFAQYPEIQAQIRQLVTRMLNFLLRNAWSVRMPNGSYSTTFWNRPDQQLTLLQIGRHVNPGRFAWIYRLHRAVLAGGVTGPMVAECRDTHGSYFKFNLDYINLYNLIRLEPAASPFRAVYVNAYNVLRGCTATHRNAHFNMIDRAISGPNPVRDRQTIDYLSKWLDRPRRDYPVDLSEYAACPPPDDRSCTIIPVNERVNTDFLWQRSPYLLYPDRPPTGRIETPAIDYLLPYWMARYYDLSFDLPIQ